MPNFTAGTSFTDGVTNDVTAAKLNALVADAVPTSSLALTSTNGTIANFTSSTANITLGTIPTIVATTLITTGTGTAAAPAIVPTGDSNTGIFFPAADTIAFSEGGTEGMRIDSSGNVGIGISPSQKLDVNGGSAIRGTLFIGDGSSSLIRKLTSSTPLTFANNAGSAEMTIDSSGNVGIGQSSLTSTLTVNKAGTDTVIQMQEGGTNTAQIESFQSSLYLNVAGANNIIFRPNSTERMRIDSSGNVGIGTTSPSGPLHIRGAAGRFAFPATSGATQSNGLTLRLNDASDDNAILDIGGNSTSGYWLQATNNANLTTNYPLLLNPNGGNVGIGTTSPATKLTVSGTSGTGSELRVVSTGANTGGRVTLYENTSGCWEFATSGGANSALTIKDLFNNAERLRIDSSGNVGINTTTIDASLHILQQAATAASGVKIQENASASKYYRVLYTDSSGIFRFNNGSNEATITLAGSFVNASDSRLKKDITDIKYGLNEVMESKPRSFSRVDVAGEYFGFIAQELQNILPEAISGDSESQLGVDYGSLVAVAFKAIQELKFENDSLKSRIEALEAA